jgi:hypothetical protein
MTTTPSGEKSKSITRQNKKSSEVNQPISSTTPYENSTLLGLAST